MGMVMPIGAGLQEKLRKIEALYAGAGTPGERDAAEAALERLRARLAKKQASEPPIEIQFSQWVTSPGGSLQVSAISR